MFTDMDAKSSSGVFEQYKQGICDGTHSDTAGNKYGVTFPRHNNSINVTYIDGHTANLNWNRVPAGGNVGDNRNFYWHNGTDDFH